MELLCGLLSAVGSRYYLLPLEETGYNLKHGLFRGSALRGYADIVGQRQLRQDWTVFGTAIKAMSWDSKASGWVTKIARKYVQPRNVRLDRWRLSIHPYPTQII